MLIDEIAEARRSAGLSQPALADRINFDVQTVKRLEKGIGSVATLVAVMTALDFRLVGIGSDAVLHAQLIALRRKRSWSLDKAAKEAGLSRTTVASLERGGGSVKSLMCLLNVLAPSARRRKPERSHWGQGDKADRDSRFTPADFMQNIYEAFGAVDLDSCGHLESPVVAQRRIILSEGGDGLADDWSDRLAFVNPPYSGALKWLRRAHEQWRAGNVKTVICLVPVRTDSAFFQGTLSADADIYLLRGRVKFLSLNGKAQHTPFSLMVVMMGATAEQRSRYAALVPGQWLARPVADHEGASALSADREIGHSSR